MLHGNDDRTPHYTALLTRRSCMPVVSGTVADEDFWTSKLSASSDKDC